MYWYSNYINLQCNVISEEWQLICNLRDVEFYKCCQYYCSQVCCRIFSIIYLLKTFNWHVRQYYIVLTSLLTLTWASYWAPGAVHWPFCSVSTEAQFLSLNHIFIRFAISKRRDQEAAVIRLLVYLLTMGNCSWLNVLLRYSG